MITKLLSQKYMYVGITGAAAVIVFLVMLPQSVMSSHTPDDVVCTGCVGTVDIASGAVTNAKIATGAVTNGKIATNAVTSTKIFDGTITAADIGGGAVTNAKLANGAVNSAKIADNSITDADIATDAIGSSEIHIGAVTGEEIADGTIRYADVSRSLIAVEHRNDCNCGGTGWDPDGTSSQELIYDDRITINSVVAVTVVGYGIACTTTVASIPEASGHAGVKCTQTIPNGMGINYAIFSNPAYG